MQAGAADNNQEWGASIRAQGRAGQGRTEGERQPPSIPSLTNCPKDRNWSEVKTSTDRKSVV